MARYSSRIANHRDGIESILLDGEVVEGVTECDTDHGWLIAYDDDGKCHHKHGVVTVEFKSAEWRQIIAAAAGLAPTNASQRQEVDHLAKTHEAVHDVLKPLDFFAMCAAVEAHILARPDIQAKTLEDFAMRLSRKAWSS